MNNPAISTFFALCLCATYLVYAAEPLFVIEPMIGATAPSSRELLVGEELLLGAENLQSNETLLLYRCGDPCNTAKEVARWRAADFEAHKYRHVKITEPGHHYFWIRRVLEDGAAGPVFGTNTAIVDDSVVLEFVSGTIIYIKLKKSHTEV